MFEGISHKFRSGCMMLARRQAESISFLGSAFLVHDGGYLLTVAHLTNDESELVVVPTTFEEDNFRPMVLDRVAAMPVEVRQRDPDRDVALLRITQDIAIGVPDDFLGTTQAVRPGASVMSLGYAFGYQRVHNLLGFNAIISAKMLSPNGSALLLYDSAFHEGDRGGPLIHVGDGHIIGIISGRFDPVEFSTVSEDPRQPLEARQTNVSYAVAIEHGLKLMHTEKLITEYFSPA